MPRHVVAAAGADRRGLVHALTAVFRSSNPMSPPHRASPAVHVAAVARVGAGRRAARRAGADSLLRQDLTWKNGLTFYLDNTEFFNPYRTGETLLGGQVLSYLFAALGPRTEVVAGFHGNHQSGDSRFLSPFKPILGFRYRTDHSLAALGTLVTEDRHGYLEPLEGRLLDITRPVEYGVQWREQRGAGGGEIFLNWQRLNTSGGGRCSTTGSCCTRTRRAGSSSRCRAMASTTAGSSSTPASPWPTIRPWPSADS